MAPPADHVDDVLVLVPADESVSQPVRMSGETKMIEGKPPDSRQAIAGPLVHRGGVDALPVGAGRISAIVVRAVRRAGRRRHLSDVHPEPRGRHPLNIAGGGTGPTLWSGGIDDALRDDHLVPHGRRIVVGVAEDVVVERQVDIAVAVAVGDEGDAGVHSHAVGELRGQ